MRRLFVYSLFILALGCDRSRAPIKIPEGSASNTSSTAPAGPTTQQLMEGPYKKVKLDPLPLTASVPESWDNKVPEGTHLNFLQGPAPDGMDVQLSLEPGSSLTPDQVKNVLQGAKKQADKDKQNIRKFEIRQMGDVQAMEEQRILTNPDNPKQQAIDWKVTYFVPRDIDTNSYTVEVLGLSQDRFEKSQALLRKIIDSIEYSPLMKITRLAPSPTGALHLGNARTFLINWILARQNGWRIILRIEDIDGPRIKPGADKQAIEDVRWLGIGWDEGPIYQLPRMSMYRAAIEQLVDSKQAYPCVCSRKEVELAASAPHAEDGAAIYPGTCRDKFSSIDQARKESGKEPAIRFRVPDLSMKWDDLFAGSMTTNPAKELGDFVIAKADGTPSYQLAVVVDDAAMGVTHIVRGDDLLDSTPRQILLYAALGMPEEVPLYFHLPLIVGEDGRRLAKRHGDTRLSHYRESGVAPQRILAMMAKWCGMGECERIELHQLLERFDMNDVPREQITFTPTDDAWLRKSGQWSGE